MVAPQSGPGFKPGLMLEFFVSQPVGRGIEPLLRHTFLQKAGSEFTIAIQK